MRVVTLLVVLLAAAPVAAQEPRLYTNADLTPKPVTAWTRTVTLTEFAGLASRQFALSPQFADGPTVIFVSLPDPRGFTPFPPTRPLSEPWSMTTYVGRPYGGHPSGGRRSMSSHAGAHASRPGIHLRYP
jgi:hypothetical protein